VAGSLLMCGRKKVPDSFLVLFLQRGGTGIYLLVLYIAELPYKPWDRKTKNEFNNALNAYHF
jgi:hypothetical protein